MVPYEEEMVLVGAAALGAAAYGQYNNLEVCIVYRATSQLRISTKLESVIVDRLKSHVRPWASDKT